MALMNKQWLVAPAASPEYLARYDGLHPVVAQIMINRGFEEPADAQSFLYARDLPSRDEIFGLSDMQEAVSRIHQAIKNHEQIAVYGDFDADGVTSTTLLTQVLRLLGAQVQPYIPNRFDEGYGLNVPALQELVRSGVQLVVTVDCGIRAVQEVIEGQKLGLDIIVTDHHSLGDVLPPACAVVNPQRDQQAEYKNLAGVGVAFMLAYALLIIIRENDPQRYPRLRLSDLLDLVAIGTVADIMPLNSKLNRSLIRHGLEVINEQRRPGVRALMEVAGLSPGGVSAMEIGFGMGPRINAAGRLEHAMIAYDLLSSGVADDVRSYAERLHALNKARQQLTRDAQALVLDQLDQEANLPLIFAGHSDFSPGIVGLVAGRLVEQFYRPAVVLEQGEHESRASCRSIPEFHIMGALDQCADLLVRHGGHAMAAGFTVANENIPELRQRLLSLADSALRDEVLAPVIEVDMELDSRQIRDELLPHLEVLEPTGHANPKPVFISRELKVIDSRTVGSEGSHLKLKLARQGQEPVDAIGFGLGEWNNHLPIAVDLVYHLELNEWNGRRTLQLNVLDLKPAEDQL